MIRAALLSFAVLLVAYGCYLHVSRSMNFVKDYDGRFAIASWLLGLIPICIGRYSLSKKVWIFVVYAVFTPPILHYFGFWYLSALFGESI